MKKNYLKEFEKSKFTAILRNIKKEDLRFVFDSLKAAGVRNVEITLNSTEYAEAFEIANTEYADSFFIGAGTVMSEKEVDLAAKCGAKYIISPHADEAIIKETKKLGLVSIPAAFTPTEIVACVNAGADYVKLFPVMHLSAKYVFALKQPLNNVKFLVVGIPEDKVCEYKTAGVDVFAAGGEILLPQKLMEQKSVEKLSEHIKRYLAEVTA